VFEDAGIRAAGLFQGIGKHGKASLVKLARREGTLLVGSHGEAGDGGSEPGRVEGGETEWVTEDVAEQVRLSDVHFVRQT
jgi:hypothetical protein